MCFRDPLHDPKMAEVWGEGVSYMIPQRKNYEALWNAAVETPYRKWKHSP